MGKQCRNRLLVTSQNTISPETNLNLLITFPATVFYINIISFALLKMFLETGLVNTNRDIEKDVIAVCGINASVDKLVK